MEVCGTIRYTKTDRVGAGEGQNSEVYRAHDPQLNGEIAVKEIPKAKFGNDPVAYFAEAQTMFAVEHDNVVAIRYACETSDLISLAMRYFPSGSLAPRIADKPLPLREFLRVADRILRGVIRIHAAGYVHFDLKPTNILFNDLDVPMVADFGQSRSFDAATGVAKPTAIYIEAMPPEVFATSAGTVHSDIFQLGLLLYRAVNSDLVYKPQRPPRHQLRDAISSGRFPNRQVFLPHVPQRLRTLIRKALRRQPEQRFATATEFADALGRVIPKYDWHTTILPNDDICWRARREGQPDVVVLLDHDPDGWRVRVYTERAGMARRAWGRQVYWRERLQRAEAMRFLDDVFTAVEQGQA